MTRPLPFLVAAFVVGSAPLTAQTPTAPRRATARASQPAAHAAPAAHEPPVAPAPARHVSLASNVADPLSPDQSRTFRAWMVRIIDVQIAMGPTPRWQHRDCAGLVRFAVAEALRPHDLGWRHANGISGRVPPDIALDAGQRTIRHRWQLADGRQSAFVTALELVQENTRFVSKNVNDAQPGDLLFFDQGDDQHLMVWTGRYIGYHTGSNSDADNGLRAVSVAELMSWRDTRWQPVRTNPNFAGVYRLRFLSR